jgi:hypothetical protein
MVVVMGFVRSKYLEYNSSIRTEKYTKNQTLNSQTKQIKQKERTTNKRQTIKLATNKINTIHCILDKRLNPDHPILARVKYLCIATLFAWMFIMRNQMS